MLQEHGLRQLSIGKGDVLTCSYHSLDQLGDNRFVEAVNGCHIRGNQIVGFDVNWAAPANIQLCFAPAAGCTFMNFVFHFRSYPGSGDGLETLPDQARHILEDTQVVKICFLVLATFKRSVKCST